MSREGAITEKKKSGCEDLTGSKFGRGRERKTPRQIARGKIKKKVFKRSRDVSGGSIYGGRLLTLSIARDSAIVWASR